MTTNTDFRATTQQNNNESYQSPQTQTGNNQYGLFQRILSSPYTALTAIAAGDIANGSFPHATLLTTATLTAARLFSSQHAAVAAIACWDIANSTFPLCTLVASLTLAATRLLPSPYVTVAAAAALDTAIGSFPNITLIASAAAATTLITSNGGRSERTNDLWSAAIHGDEEMATRLINSGININSVNSDGNTPLELACRHGQEKIVSLLIQSGANVNFTPPNALFTPLCSACEHAHEKIALLLINSGADVNATTRKDNNPPLHQALRNFEADTVAKALIEKGANIRATGIIDQTALHDACSGNHYEIVEFLISKGLDVNATNCEGVTPLAAAIQNPKIITLLLNKGANPNLKNKWGFTPTRAYSYSKDIIENYINTQRQ